MKMVLMTRMKTSSASLIAREQVAVAVGSPCGVYQYLVGALSVRDRELYLNTSTLKKQNWDDLRYLTSMQMIISTRYPDVLGTLHLAYQSKYSMII